MEEALLAILRANLLAQTAYTPQAERFVQNVPISFMPPVSTQSTAYYNPMEGIKINRQAMNNPNLRNMLLGITRHEILHGLDKSISDRYSFEKNDLGNSLNFINTLNQTNPFSGRNMTQWLNDLQYSQDYSMRNLEGFAQYGGPQGQYSLLSPPNISQYYKNIYQPVEKQLNYNPMFPALR